MKANYLILLVAATMFGMAACSKDDSAEPNNGDDNGGQGQTEVVYQEVIKAALGGVGQDKGWGPASIYIALYTEPYSPNGSTLSGYKATLTTDANPDDLLLEVDGHNEFVEGKGQVWVCDYNKSTLVYGSDCEMSDSKATWIPPYSKYQWLTIKPIVGEFTVKFKMDFLDPTNENKPFRYFATPAYTLKMWQDEDNLWCASLEPVE